MDIALYNQYQVPIDLAYSFLIAVIAGFIAFKAKKLYDLSTHKGIRFFGLAFMFFSWAFFIQFFGILIDELYQLTIFAQAVLSVLFSYAISLSGFYLVYSLVWKQAREMRSIRLRIAVLHVLALTIAVLELLYAYGWVSFVFLAQLLALLYGIIICHAKYQRAKGSFLQMYFIALVLMFTGWLLNYLSVIAMMPVLTVYVNILTLAIFLIFLYGVIKVTKHGKKKRTP